MSKFDELESAHLLGDSGSDGDGTSSTHFSREFSSSRHLIPFSQSLKSFPRRLVPRTKRQLLAFSCLSLCAVVLILTFISFLLAIFDPPYTKPPAHYQALQRFVQDSSRLGRGNLRDEKVYIAANIVDAELIRGAWGQSLIELVDLLGPDNTFISIYENDSGNETESALREIDSKLSCKSYR